MLLAEPRCPCSSVATRAGSMRVHHLLLILPWCAASGFHPHSCVRRVVPNTALLTGAGVEGRGDRLGAPVAHRYGVLPALEVLQRLRMQRTPPISILLYGPKSAKPLPSMTTTVPPFKLPVAGVMLPMTILVVGSPCSAYAYARTTNLGTHPSMRTLGVIPGHSRSRSCRESSHHPVGMRNAGHVAPPPDR